MSAVQGYNVTARVNLHIKNVNIIKKIKLSTNNFGVVFAICAVDVDLIDESEGLLGSIFDDIERLVLPVNKRLGFSDNDDCFVRDDADEVERV